MINFFNYNPVNFNLKVNNSQKKKRDKVVMREITAKQKSRS